MLEKLEAWCRKKPKNWRHTLILIHIFIFTSFLSNIFFGILLASFGIEHSSTTLKNEDALALLTKNGLIAFVLIMLSSVVLEEFLCRFLPLAFARRITPNFKPIFIVLVIFSVIVFGWIHGEIWNIFIQGTVGLFLGLLYLKNGGLERKHAQAFMTVVLFHFLYNMYIVLLVLSI